MSYQESKFREKHKHNKLEQWKKTGTFCIFINISEYVTVVQLMDSIGNVNHAVSVAVKWIFLIDYEKSLLLTIESFNLICACSDEDE